MEQAGEKPVKAVIHRCPFCHEGAEPEGSVACQGCLARHHEACWTEAGRCGSCGSQQALAPMARPALTVELATKALRERGYPAGEVETFFASLKAPPASRRRLGASQLVATLVALAALALLGLQVVRRWEGARARERQVQMMLVQQKELETEQALIMKELERLSALGPNTTVHDEARRQELYEDLLTLKSKQDHVQRSLDRATSDAR